MADSSARPHGPRVVVADDDAMTRDGLAGLLRDAGYEVEVAADGIEALQACRRFHPDVLLTDLDMPRLRGEALIDTLLTDDPSLAVVVISGEHPSDAGRRAASLGARQFFGKPIDLDEVLKRLDEIVHEGGD